MPIFQKVAHNGYNVLPESRFIKRSLVARHRKAEKLIGKLPNIAKGYIDLAKVYIEKNNLRAALEIYNDRIQSMLSSLSFIDNKMNSSDNLTVDNDQQNSQRNNDDDGNASRKKLNGSHSVAVDKIVLPMILSNNKNNKWRRNSNI